MRRSALLRFLAFLFAVTAGVASPMAALAHGWAHHHEHEEAEHATIGIGHGTDEHSEHVAAAIDRPTAENGDHPHPTVGDALTARVPQLLAVVTPLMTVPTAVVLNVPARPWAVTRREPYPSFAHAPPPRLRAPPTASPLT